MIVYAYAKINLGLDTLYKRQDGFHEVEMIMASVDLCDIIELTLLEEDEIIFNTNASHVPHNDSNLAYIAAQLLKDRYNITKGVSIHLEKKIPVSAGLAGGSTDAAAVLRGLNELWNLNLSLEQLYELGKEIGSDVNYCIYGKLAKATGRGEIITPIEGKIEGWIILAKPLFGVSTKEVYQNLDCNKVNHPNLDKIIEAIETNDYDKLCNNIGNTLESVTLNLYPEVKDLKERMQRVGCDAVLMSGSGPSVFGLVSNEKKAKRIYNSIKGFCKDIYILKIR